MRIMFHVCLVTSPVLVQQYEVHQGQESSNLQCAGLMAVLECAMPSVQIHVFPPPPTPQPVSLHDVAAEAELLKRMHASGVVVLHEGCSQGIRCTARPGGVALQGNEGLVAPGVKLYLHRKKWQDSSMRVYSEEEEDEDDETA